MEDLATRIPTEEELERFFATGEATFGGQLRADDLPRWKAIFDRDRLLWALDGESPVATAAALSFRFTVPGGEVPAAGVTWVGVLPSHRRRGILTRLMREQLDDVRERGEPIAVLWASEPPIYGRFGYGLASQAVRLDADRDRAVFRLPAEPVGEARLVPLDRARELVADVYDRIRRENAGMFARSEAWWTQFRLADPERERHGGGPLFCAVIEVDGAPEGYALYRHDDSWEAGIPKTKLNVREAIATSPATTRDLWRFLFGVDLIERVVASNLPIDHPLQLMVADPRRLRLGLSDALWVRFIDLEAALTARSYAAHDSLVLDVQDAFCGWSAGVWQLEVSSEGAQVTKASREADLRLDTADLASTYLGGFSFAQLERAGRLEVVRPGAVERADALFRTPRAPWCPEVF